MKRTLGIRPPLLGLVYAAAALPACGDVHDAQSESLASAPDDDRPAYTIRAEVAAPDAAARYDSMEIHLRVTMGGSERATVPALASPRDRTILRGIEVRDETGALVWRDLPDATGDTVTLALAPSDTLHFTLLWPLVDLEGDIVAPGTYTVQGIVGILDEPPPLSESAPDSPWASALRSDPDSTDVVPAPPTFSYSARVVGSGEVEGTPRIAVRALPEEIRVDIATGRTGCETISGRGSRDGSVVTVAVVVRETGALCTGTIAPVAFRARVGRLERGTYHLRLVHDPAHGEARVFHERDVRVP